MSENGATDKTEYVKPALVKHELLRDVAAIQLSRVLDRTPTYNMPGALVRAMELAG